MGIPRIVCQRRCCFQGWLWFFGIVEGMSDSSSSSGSLLPEFFDYTCDRCGAPVCERMQIMNLALDNIDDLYCLACLAEEQDMAQPALADFAREYVYSRECFKTPWDAVDAKGCPRLSTGECYCQDPDSSANAAPG